MSVPMSERPTPQPPTMPGYGQAPGWQRRPPRRRWILPVVIAACVLLVGGVTAAVVLLGGGGAATTFAFTLSGTLTIEDSSPSTYFPSISFSDGSGGSCQGDNGYGDLVPGAAVIVQDSTGHTIGTGALQAGTGNGDTSGGGAATCVMPFSVPNVPAGLSSYSVTISHRGTQVIPASEAQSGVALTIGGN